MHPAIHAFWSWIFHFPRWPFGKGMYLIESVLKLNSQQAQWLFDYGCSHSKSLYYQLFTPWPFGCFIFHSMAVHVYGIFKGTLIPVFNAINWIKLTQLIAVRAHQWTQHKAVRAHQWTQHMTVRASQWTANHWSCSMNFSSWKLSQLQLIKL